MESIPQILMELRRETGNWRNIGKSIVGGQSQMSVDWHYKQRKKENQQVRWDVKYDQSYCITNIRQNFTEPLQRIWVVEGSCRREHPKAFCGLGGVPRPCPRGLRSGLVGGDLLLEVLLCVWLCTGLASVSHGTRSSPRGKRHQGHGFYRWGNQVNWLMLDLLCPLWWPL